jgi:hypothetical protein
VLATINQFNRMLGTEKATIDLGHHEVRLQDGGFCWAIAPAMAVYPTLQLRTMIAGDFRLRLLRSIIAEICIHANYYARNGSAKRALQSMGLDPNILRRTNDNATAMARVIRSIRSGIPLILVDNNGAHVETIHAVDYTGTTVTRFQVCDPYNGNSRWMNWRAPNNWHLDRITAIEFPLRNTSDAKFTQAVFTRLVA